MEDGSGEGVEGRFAVGDGGEAVFERTGREDVVELVLGGCCSCRGTVVSFAAEVYVCV